MPGKTRVVAIHHISRWTGREYLRLECKDIRWPAYLTADSTKEAKEFCDKFLGEDNWDLQGDTL